MKRKNLERKTLRKRAVIKDIDDSYSQTVESLEHAWNNLPDDLTQDERVMFFDLAEKVLRNFKSEKSSESN